MELNRENALKLLMKVEIQSSCMISHEVCQGIVVWCVGVGFVCVCVYCYFYRWFKGWDIFLVWAYIYVCAISFHKGFYSNSFFAHQLMTIYLDYENHVIKQIADLYIQWFICIDLYVLMYFWSYDIFVFFLRLVIVKQYSLWQKVFWRVQWLSISECK